MTTVGEFLADWKVYGDDKEFTAALWSFQTDAYAAGVRSSELNRDKLCKDIETLATKVEQLRAALKLWKVYFQTEDGGPLTNPEQAGEDFTEAWFEMEKALNP